MIFCQRIRCWKNDVHSAAALFLFVERLSTASELGCTSLRIFIASTGGCLSNISLNFTSHELESLVDVLALLGRGFEESHAVVVGHFLALFEGNCSFAFKIHFVSNQNARDIVLCVLFHLAHPGVYSIEGVSISDIVGHNDAVGSLVITGGDCLKALLASSVPDLKLAHFVV